MPLFRWFLNLSYSVNPRFALTDSLAQIIKIFQNPVWVEQTRERLKQIKTLTTQSILI